MKKFIQKNHYLMVLMVLSITQLLLAVTAFRGSFANLWNAVAGLWQSIVSYFRFIIFFELPTQSPISPPIGGDGTNILPDTPSEFWSRLGTFFRQLFDGDNFIGYVSLLENLFLFALRALPFFILLIVLIKIMYRRSLSSHNNNYNKDTFALKSMKAISGKTYVPAKSYLTSLHKFVWSQRWFKLFMTLWILLSLNLIAIGLSMISTALYFSISFNFVELYNFVLTSISLLATGLSPVPNLIIVLLVVIFVLRRIDRWRKQIALSRLRRMEASNKNFIVERAICMMLVGTMGKGKTTLATDISLSTEAIFRNKAYEMMLDIDLKFPNFPYILLEQELKKEMEAGRVYNLATCGEFITVLQEEFENLETHLGSRAQSWYDYIKYGLNYDDKKSQIYLFDALRDYAKLYFIYVVSSSLIISNYAIRTDFNKIDMGNMPMWNLDFFQRDAVPGKGNSKYSHILDFDMLRLGKKLVENNKNAQAFEFGVIAITEIGKERGNRFKDDEIKETIKQLRATIKDLDRIKEDSSTHRKELAKLTDRATHLTDKFNDSLKLIRHKCTVAGFPFARVILDEQRPESLGADARDLCEIIHIRDKSHTKLAMPFYFIGELVYVFIFPKFKGAYHEHRFNRGDNTLTMHIFKKFGAIVHRSKDRIYNRFGYHVRMLAVENSGDGSFNKEQKYYLSTKKIYSNRFSTDAYADIFAKNLKTVGVGIDMLPTYENEKASEAEFKQQNSYFMEEIFKHNQGDPKGTEYPGPHKKLTE